MPLQQLGKIVVIFGVAALVVGLLLMLGGRIGLGSLPGDFSWRRGNTTVYIPIVTSIVLSILLTVVLNLIFRFFR